MINILKKRFANEFFFYLFIYLVYFLKSIEMIKNIKNVFGEMINETIWMDSISKKAAIEKV